MGGHRWHERPAVQQRHQRHPAAAAGRCGPSLSTPRSTCSMAAYPCRHHSGTPHTHTHNTHLKGARERITPNTSVECTTCTRPASSGRSSSSTLPRPTTISCTLGAEKLP